MPRIDEMWAWLAEDDEGEGVAAFMGPNGAWMPMVGADRERMESLREIATMISEESDTQMTLVRFYYREVVDVIDPH